MTDYIALRIDFTPCSEDITDLAAALLADGGFESFTPDSEGLTAYIPVSMYSAEQTSRCLEDFPFETKMILSTEVIEGKNWNEEWERHYFQPIVIADRVVIHSSFHHDIPEAKYDIVVDPKMAFGTGHHFTTRLMIESILSFDMKNTSVIDMGTGTGILAILCAMRGAASVTGIEIDPGAWENAVENVGLNKVSAEMKCGDAALLPTLPPADFFLANINRNIILSDLHAYASALKAGGKMMLSGFYESDAPMITEAALPLGLVEVGRRVDNDWTVLILQKS